MIFCTTCKIQYYWNRNCLFLHNFSLQRLQYCHRYKKKEVLILLKAFGHKKVARPKTFVNRIVIMVETIQNSHSKIIRERRLLRYISISSICTAEGWVGRSKFPTNVSLRLMNIFLIGIRKVLVVWRRRKNNINSGHDRN